MSVINVKGKKALLEWHKESKSGSLKLVLGDGSTLLTLTGDNVQKADLGEAFPKALDLEKLEKTLAE
jgi:hypothetical protein